jgi:tetratricopeptide (TPR) repeat protein
MPFELHDDAEVQAVAHLLDANTSEDRRCIIFSGSPDGTRESLLDAAVSRLRGGGQSVLYSRIDLDGFEPDVVSPQEYARYLGSKLRGGQIDQAAEALATRLSGETALRVEQFALLALVAGRDDQSDALAARANEALEPGGVRWEKLVPDPEQAVVLHLEDSSQLPALLRAAVLALDIPGLTVAVSCYATQDSKQVVGPRPAARFELMPMDQGEVRSWLREQVNETSAENAAAFTDACRGSRGLLGLIASEGDWSTPLTPPRALDRLIASSDEDHQKTLRAFLVHAALCGENVPVRTILDYLGIEAEQVDDWTDLIDETVGEDSPGRLFGSRFQHPGFVGEIVYGFREPAWRERLRLAAPDDSRRRVAQQFAAWLFQNRPTTTRAAARLLVELCYLGGIDGDRQALERELAWWAGDADLDALRALLIAERRPLNEIWTAVNAVQTHWPPQRVLALLDAAQQLGVDKQAQSALYTIRAGLFIRLQRFEEALDSAGRALAAADAEPLLESVLLEQRGSARRALGRDAEAFADFERCRALRLELLAAGDGRVVPLLQRSLELLRQAGRIEETAVVEKALADYAARTPA